MCVNENQGETPAFPTLACSGGAAGGGTVRLLPGSCLEPRMGSRLRPPEDTMPWGQNANHRSEMKPEDNRFHVLSGELDTRRDCKIQ